MPNHNQGLDRPQLSSIPLPHSLPFTPQPLQPSMGLQLMRGRPCAPCCSSSSSSNSSPRMPPKHSHPPLSGRSTSSESLRLLALHFLLKRRQYLNRDIMRTSASSSSVLQITQDKSSSLPKTKVNAERRALADALDRKSQFDMIDEDFSFWMDRSYTSSNLQYNLLMQNIHALESSLAGKDLVMLERDILVHIKELGALKLFNASMSRATLTQTSHELDFSLPGNITKFYQETAAVEENDQVIVRSGKSQERKLKRMRASEKGSRITVKASSRKPKKSRKSSSSQFIAEWKNYPGRRRSIIREQSALLVAIKECANLEKIRENLLKGGQDVCYDRWAKAAGVDEAVLKSRLQAGYCCRERLLVTTEWLVKYIARTYTGMGTAFEDLLQAGKMGVLDGAEKFDSQKGCKFSTYVKYWIRKAMLALLAENSGVIQLPARMESIIRKVKEARRTIRSNTGRNPIDSEIATIVGVSIANVRLARKCSRRVVSLHAEIGVGQNAKFMEVTPDTSLEAPDEAIFRRQLRERLLLVLDRLPAREGRVLKLRHGLEDGKCRSLEQIGSIYHVSKEWIRKIEKSAMSKLRNEDVHHELKDFCGF